MKAGPRLVCVAALIAVGAQRSSLAAETPVPIELRSSNGRWLVRIATDQPSVVHLGIDTEGTGRETHNLLREPLRLSWMFHQTGKTLVPVCQDAEQRLRQTRDPSPP